jgi:hypothetical protein
MTDRELLTKYLEVKDTPAERVKILLEHAEPMFQGEEGD